MYPNHHYYNHYQQKQLPRINLPDVEKIIINHGSNSTTLSITEVHLILSMVVSDEPRTEYEWYEFMRDRTHVHVGDMSDYNKRTRIFSELKELSLIVPIKTNQWTQKFIINSTFKENLLVPVCPKAQEDDS